MTKERVHCICHRRDERRASPPRPPGVSRSAQNKARKQQRVLHPWDGSCVCVCEHQRFLQRSHSRHTQSSPTRTRRVTLARLLICWAGHTHAFSPNNGRDAKTLAEMIGDWISRNSSLAIPPPKSWECRMFCFWDLLTSKTHSIRQKRRGHLGGGFCYWVTSVKTTGAASKWSFSPSDPGAVSYGCWFKPFFVISIQSKATTSGFKGTHSHRDDGSRPFNTRLQPFQMCLITLCEQHYFFHLVQYGKTNTVHQFPAQAIHLLLRFVPWDNQGTFCITFCICMMHLRQMKQKLFMQL